MAERGSGVVSPEGFAVFASVGGDRQPMPESTDEFCIIDQCEEVIRYQCGHPAPSRFVANFYGERSTTIDQEECCPECWLENARALIIRCALCGFAITPGDPVALYGASSSGLRPDATKVLDSTSVMGCLRWDCCPSGGFFAGHWTGQDFESAFSDSESVVGKVMRTGQVVSVGDTTRMGSATQERTQKSHLPKVLIGIVLAALLGGVLLLIR